MDVGGFVLAQCAGAAAAWAVSEWLIDREHEASTA
jgi:hypothetical protein